MIQSRCVSVNVAATPAFMPSNHAVFASARTLCQVTVERRELDAEGQFPERDVPVFRNRWVIEKKTSSSSARPPRKWSGPRRLRRGWR